MVEKKEKKTIDGRKAAFERRRRKGYDAYLKRKHKEMAQRKKEEEKKKEKERKRKEKEKKKRPVGRPKKRGPKKKQAHTKKISQKKGKRTLPPFAFKIISCRNGKQNKFIGKYRTSEEAYEVFEHLKLNDKNVIFQSNITIKNELKNSIDEYILIEKSDGEDTFLRNEYGKMVKQTLNKDGWIIKDKYRYKVEEEFWVWGYHKINDRKTFMWIYENIITNINTYFDYKRILIYKNKLVVKHDNGKIDIVFCKNESDAVRFYNLTETYVKRDKIKQVVFIGNFSKISPRRKKLEDELMEITGWTRKKIQMKNSTYCKK